MAEPRAERGPWAAAKGAPAWDCIDSVVQTLQQEMPPAICPHCGTRVPTRAKACPECGADESTGWSESARNDELDLPDEDFNYDEFTRREFGGASGPPRGRHWFWWLVALFLVIGFLLLWLR